MIKAYANIGSTPQFMPSTIEMHIGMMPLRGNVPVPRDIEDWQLKTCPVCGRECWYQKANGDTAKRIMPDLVFLRTECALKNGMMEVERE